MRPVNAMLASLLPVPARCSIHVDHEARATSSNLGRTARRLGALLVVGIVLGACDEEAPAVLECGGAEVPLSTWVHRRWTKLANTRPTEELVAVIRANGGEPF